MNYTYLAYNLIRPGDRVLDIGGSGQPFRRANAVIDVQPYEMRYVRNSFLRALPQHFTKDSWVVQDICDSSKPFPFKDKEFDFVLCAQVLEDIRDPIYVVREIQRVGKRGLIEIPSRFYEQLSGLEFPNMSGAQHHRWIIELRKNKTTGKNELVFTFKDHKVHRDPYRIMRPRFKTLTYPYLNPFYESLDVLWDEEFAVYEDVDEAIAGTQRFLKETVALADQLGDELWDQSQGLPVSLKGGPEIGGVFNILEMKDRWSDQRVRSYDSKRKRSQESLDYEQQLLGLPARKMDRRVLKRRPLHALKHLMPWAMHKVARKISGTPLRTSR